MDYHIGTKGNTTMTAADKISSILKENNGTITVDMVTSQGLSKTTFYSYVREHPLTRADHGIYIDETLWKDDLFILSLRSSKIVFSHETALYLHGLTDREPLQLTVTTASGNNLHRIKQDGVKVYNIKPELFDIGRTVLKTQFGNEVPVYNLERTICDIVRSRKGIDPQILQQALKQYVQLKRKDLNKLMEYASQLGIRNILRGYLEILL